MNRIYDLGNTSRVGFWCAAPDEATAREIAVKAGHAKKPGNLRVRDITEKVRNDKGMSPIIGSEQTGRLIYQGVSYTFAEVVAGVKREAKGWMFA